MDVEQRKRCMISNRVRSIINVLCFILVLVTNYLATALPINGVTQKELSAEYQIFLTPAGYVFAIWGLIYLGLTAYITVQAFSQMAERFTDSWIGRSFCGELCMQRHVADRMALSLSIDFGCVDVGTPWKFIWTYTRLEHNRLASESSSLWFADRTL